MKTKYRTLHLNKQVALPPMQPISPGSPPSYFASLTRHQRKRILVNREISWLRFNEKVLQEAADPSVPLPVRLKFLGIFSSNLDEFFRVRVASLNRLVEVNKQAKVEMDMSPKKILRQINKQILAMQQQFEAIYSEVKSELANEQVFIVNENELTQAQGYVVRQFFHVEVRPLLVPLMVSSLRKIPDLKDGVIYLAISLRKSAHPTQKEMALVEIPSDKLSRFFMFERSNNRTFVILLDDVIRYCLTDMFGIFGFDQCSAWTIKLTKDSEMELDADLSKTQLELIASGVKQRKHGQPVRFIYDKQMDIEVLKQLVAKMGITADNNILPGGRYHNFKDFMNFPLIPSLAAILPMPHRPLPHPDIDPRQSLFSLLQKKDILLHYPYQTFYPVIDFLREAAIDPKVKFIKATIYRVARQSSIINALLNAQMNGKKVTVVIELQARFDEEANIQWTNTMKEAGLNIIHGQLGFKIHSKLLLVGREEYDEQKQKNTIKLYANIGTGNFNERTAQTYCDDSLLTQHAGITSEIAKVFKFIETQLPNQPVDAYPDIGKLENFKHILISPKHLFNKLIQLIDTEIAHAKAKKPAYIILKLNGLNDETIIGKLYEASNAGVKIWLIVRSICCLVPGVENHSKNIEAISIVDEFLEHSRIYYFYNNGKTHCYIASADCMERNLHRRIEVACPIYDPLLKKELETILTLEFQVNVKARLQNYPDLPPNGYVRNGLEPTRSQHAILHFFNQLLKGNVQYKALPFEQLNKLVNI